MYTTINFNAPAYTINMQRLHDSPDSPELAIDTHPCLRELCEEHALKVTAPTGVSNYWHIRNGVKLCAWSLSGNSEEVMTFDTEQEAEYALLVQHYKQLVDEPRESDGGFNYVYTSLDEAMKALPELIENLGLEP